MDKKATFRLFQVAVIIIMFLIVVVWQSEDFGFGVFLGILFYYLVAESEKDWGE